MDRIGGPQAGLMWSRPSQVSRVQGIQPDSHIPRFFPHQFPANSQTPKVARDHWRRRGACQMRSTSTSRQFDFGDCGPPQPPKSTLKAR